MALLLALAALGAGVPGAPTLREEGGLLLFSNGIVELRVDASTGIWRSFGRSGEPIVLGRGETPAGSVAVRTPGGWTLDGEASRRLGHRVEAGEKETFLVVTRRQGPWEISERYGLRPGVDALSRSATLTLRDGDPVEVAGVRLSLEGACVGEAAGCRFLVPDRFPPEIVPYTSLKPGRITGLSGQSDLLTVVHHEGAQRGLAAAALSLTDACYGSVVEGVSALQIHHEFLAAQTAPRDKAFTVGTQYVRLVEGDFDATLTAAQQVFALAGHGLPADVPADAAECIIYSAHAGGTIDSGMRDGGGGFRSYAERIPYLADLGANTFWMLPFWHGPVYAPVAYDRLDERLGSEADLKALVDTAHQHGARVLADLIPHGPRPESGLEKTHPEWISRDREGGFRHMWGCYDCDYAHPGWRQFMADHAVDWVRRVGLDGYRVDVALGQQENWRPHGDNRPGNSRVGGIRMLEKVRQAIHREKPSCVLLAEATHSGLWSSCEMVYDFPFTYQVAQRAVTMPPAEFVPAMRRWLQWQRALLPDGALPMRYVESHDTIRARLMYGPGLYRAFLGLICTVRGVPMLYDEGETGYEPFLRTLLAARKAHPALTRGQADYLAVDTGAPEVCGILRTVADGAAVVAVNFTGRAVEARLSVAASRLLGKVADGAWHDALGATVEARREGAALRLRVPLVAYGTAVLVPGAAPAAKPVPARKPGAVSADGCIEHRNAHYRLLVERKSGLLKALLAPDGTPLLSEMAIREGPRKLFIGSDPVEWSRLPDARFAEKVSGDGRALEFSGTVTRGGGVGGAAVPVFRYALSYIVDDTASVGVELRLAAQEALDDVNGMLVQTLKLPAGAEWFAETLEGELRGETVARHPNEQPRFAGRYRHRQPWALWEERLFPLAGSFGARLPGGPGIAISGAKASLPGWRQNLALRAPALGKKDAGCRAELRWLDGKGAVSLPAGGSVSLRFDAVVLPPGGEGVTPAAQPATGPRLSVEGPRYTVENAHYRATLVRSQGGALVDLRKPNGASLLRESVVYSDRGLYGDYKDPAGREHRTSASAQDDIEPEMTLERADGRLVIGVESTLRHPFGGYRTVLRPMTRVRLRYTFDESPEVAAEVSILPPVATSEPVFLAQRMHLSGVKQWSVGDRQFAVSEKSADRVWQSKVTPLPAGGDLRFEGEGALAVTGIDLPEGFANLFVVDSGGGKLVLFAAPNDGTPIPVRQWTTFRYRLKPE